MIFIYAITENLLHARQCAKHLNYFISFTNNNFKRQALLLCLIYS